jgi:hypothetical protein
MAGEEIKKGSFVMQYVGEVYSIDCGIGQKRLQKNDGSTCTYLMQVDNNYVVDPTKAGNMARFANHSCDPNCEISKWHVNGEICVGIFAIKDIAEGEELTFKYNFDMYNTALLKCQCGASNCQGYLGVRPKDLDNEKWGKHLKNLACEVCQKKSEQKNNEMLLCDYCNKGFHLKCIDMEKVPTNDWYCSDCNKLEKKKNNKKVPSFSLTLEDIKKVYNDLVKELPSLCAREPEYCQAYNFTYELQYRLYCILHPKSKKANQLEFDSERYQTFEKTVCSCKYIPPSLDSDFKSKLVKLSTEKYDELSQYLKLIRKLLIDVSIISNPSGVYIELYGNVY